MVRFKGVRPLKASSSLFTFGSVFLFAMITSGCDMLLEPVGAPPPIPKPTPVQPSPAKPEPVEPIDPPSLDEPTEETKPSDIDEVAPPATTTEPSDEPSGETSDPIVDEEPVEEPEPVVEPVFDYFPPGDLEPNSGSGSIDRVVYVPDMVFPIRAAPSYPQSQVYRFGGGVGGGDQCDERNFEAAWRDNFCEKRTRQTTSPYCPTAGVHVGQDIRVGTPEGCMAERRSLPEERTRYEVVAAEDGYISNIGKYTVNVRAGGRIYRYMHMNMRALQVAMGQSVKAGDVLGYVSNDFAGTPTTLHLHFEIKHNTAEHGWTWAPPYTSLVQAYERREQAPGKMLSTE